jgi:hypothetical protein
LTENTTDVFNEVKPLTKCKQNEQFAENNFKQTTSTKTEKNFLYMFCNLSFMPQLTQLVLMTKLVFGDLMPIMNHMMVTNLMVMILNYLQLLPQCQVCQKVIPLISQKK